MFLWLNGPFGGGKTTTARCMQERAPGWRLFDPEWVGYLLRAQLAGIAFEDFQDLPAWRALVPAVAHHVAIASGDDLVAVQTVLTEAYWDEISRGFAELGHDVFHVLLDADEDALRARIAADRSEPGAEGWRREHIAPYTTARTWLLARADLVVDTTELPPDAAAARILAALTTPP